MSGKARVLVLAVIMVAVTAGAVAAAIAALYDAAFDQQRARLVEIAQSNARLIDAIARFDKQRGADDVPREPFAATMAKLTEAHRHFAGFGETGEFTLARREGDEIVFLLSHRHHDLDRLRPVPWDSDLAAPMRQALSGESGTLIGPDYRGATVLAAYESAPELGVGVVAKLDLAEVRRPFMRAGLLSSGVGLVLVCVGAVVFRLIGNPLVRRLEESEQKYRTLFASASDAVVVFGDVATDCNERACELLGAPRSEIIGHAPREFWPATQPDGRDSLSAGQAIIQAALAGTPQLFYWQLRRKDGELIDAEIALKAVPLGGRPALLVAMREISARRRAEDALRASEQKYRQIIETAQEGILMMDAEFRTVFVNQRAAELFGYAPDEMVGRPVTDLMAPEEYADHAERMRHRAEGRAEQYERRFRRKDGRELVALVSATPQVDNAGRFRGSVSMLSDISALKRAETTARASEQRYRELVDRMGSAVAVYQAVDDGADFVFVEFNRAGRRIEHVTREEVVGRRVTDVFPGVRAFGLLDVLQRVYQTGRPEHYPAKVYRDERVTGWRENFVYRLPSGEVVAVYDDLTAQKQAEEELARAERAWRDIFHAIGQPAVILDPEHGIIAANQAVLEATHRTESELLGRKCHEVFHGPESACPPDKCPMETLLRSGQPATVEMEMAALGGTYLVSCTPVLDEHGRVEKIIHIATDITARKRAEDALRANERFLAGVFESIQDGMSVLDADLTILRVNSNMERWYAQHAPLAGKKCYHCYQGRTGPCEPCPSLRSVRSGQVERDIVPGAPGSAVEWIELFSYPIKDAESGRVTGVVEFVRDITERRRAEEELRKLALVVRYSGELVNLATLEGQMVFLNDAGSRMLGIDPRDVAQHQILEVIPESCLAVVQSELLPALRRGDTWEGELQYRNIQTGGLTDVHAMTFTMKDPNTGAPLYLANVSLDITERKRAEAERDRLFNLSLDPLCIAGFDGFFRQVNPAWERTLGWSEEELLNKPWLDFVHPDDLRATIAAGEALGQGREVRDFENRYRCRDGSYRWLSWNSFALPEQKLIFAVCRDATEQKRVQDELRKANTFLRAVVEQAPFGIQVCEGSADDWQLTLINREAQGLLGVTEEQHRGLGFKHGVVQHPEKLVWQMFYADGRPWDLFDVPLPAAMIAGKVTRNEEMIVRRADGAERTILCNAAPIHDDQGALLGAVVTYPDITEHKLLESQLRQAQKMEAVGQLAGGVAHDFNNILTSILGNAELALNRLRKQLPAEGRVLEEVQQIERSAERAAALTRQLLAFSRRQVARPQVLDLNGILANLEAMIRRLIAENIVLELCCAAEPARVEADVTQLEQVILNLVVNARDAMPGGGTLTIETSLVTLDEEYREHHAEARLGPHVLLAVSDTGCGMDAVTKERIFEPFFTTKPVGEGTGLGLATVYGIVKQSGGHVMVYSEPERGSTFRIYLPASQISGPAAAVAPQTPATVAGTETLLVCEDDEMVRRLTAQMLTGAGYTVLSAADGAQAVHVASTYTGPIHLLVTDVIMPDINGRKLAETLQATRPQLQTLYMSGYTANVIAHHGVLDPGIHLLEKPFSRTALLQAVRRVLDEAEQTSG